MASEQTTYDKGPALQRSGDTMFPTENTGMVRSPGRGTFIVAGAACRRGQGGSRTRSFRSSEELDLIRCVAGRSWRLLCRGVKSSDPRVTGNEWGTPTAVTVPGLPET